MMMSAQGFLNKQIKNNPTREKKRILKEQDVNLKNKKHVLEATNELREKNKPAPVVKKPTQEELLADILVELRKQSNAK